MYFLLSSLLLQGFAQATASYADLGIPASCATVSIQVFNSGTGVTIPAPLFVFPVVPGRENLAGDIYAFLVEHGDERIMFDIGLRKDFLNLTPLWTSLITSGELAFNVTEDMPTQLTNGNVSLDSITSVIWRYGYEWKKRGITDPSFT